MRRPLCISLPLCFKYHSSSLFVNPWLIIWNRAAISHYSDFAPSISAGQGIERMRKQKKKDTKRDKERERQKENKRDQVEMREKYDKSTDRFFFFF